MDGRRSFLSWMALLCSLPARAASAAAPGTWVCSPCGCPRDKDTFTAPGPCPGCGMALVPSGTAAPTTAPVEIGRGVHVIRHRGQQFGQGNTLVVAGTREALVVDSCFIPAVARKDIDFIRELTDRPVRYLVNTHWHNDHNAGNAAYMQAFPGLAVVAHAETRRDMDLHVASLPSRLTQGIAERQARLEAGKGEDGRALGPEARKRAEEELAQRRRLEEHYRDFAYQRPTLTFEDHVTLDLGDREVQVRHLGRGNTSGDVVAFVPDAKVVATGDLLVRPLPYFYDGYPRDWVGTLDRLAGLGAQVTVPGHGEVMRDDVYLRAVRDLLASALEQMDAALKRKGPAEFLALEAVKDEIDLSAFRERFAAGDPELAAAFDAETAPKLVKLVFTEASLR
jgi:cyclase